MIKLVNACCAVAAFVAYWYEKITVDRLLLLKTLAVLQIFVSVTNLVTRVGTLDKVWTCTHACVITCLLIQASR